MGIAEVVRLIKYAILAIPIIIIIISGILMIRIPRGRKLWEFKANIKILKNYWKLIVIVGVLHFACFIAVRYLESWVSSEITIGFDYEEASRGLNPNSTRFNTYDVINDDILSKVIQSLNRSDISESELREALRVEPLQAGEEVSAEQYYVSTEYVLQYNATWKTILLNGEDVVKMTAEEYHRQFLDQYKRKTDRLELDFTELDEADYLDKVSILAGMTSDMKEYMSMCSLENSTYTDENGENFASLAAKMENFQNVEIEGLESYILIHGLSENSDQQIAKLSYENLMKDINYKKNIASYKVRLETIDMYERDMASVVLVPTQDETGEFYMSRTKIGVDNFADEAETASQNASKAQNDILSNQYAITQIQNSKSGELEKITADEKIESMKKSLLQMAETGKKMIEKYDAQNEGDFLIVTWKPFTPFKVKFLAKCAVLFLVMIISVSVFAWVKPEKTEM